MPYPTGAITGLLRLLHPVDANAVVFHSADESSFESRDLPTIEAAQSAGLLSVSLEDAEGLQHALAFYLEGGEVPARLEELYGTEDLCIGNKESGDLILVYLFDEPISLEYISSSSELFPDSYLVEIPLPDGDRWKFDQESFSKLTTNSYEDFNDAKIWGVLDEDVLAHPIRIAIGRDQHHKIWNPVDSTVGQFIISQLSHHKVGPKEGACFIQGHPISTTDQKVGNRKATMMSGLHLFGVDVDSGTPIDPLLAKLKEFGFLCVVYTTHSHLKTETEVKQASYLAWCKKNKIDDSVSDDKMRQHLLSKKVEPYIVKDLKITDTRHTSEGAAFVVSHAPWPKYRVIFFLNEEFKTITADQMQPARLNLWKGKLLGLGRLLGVPIDNSCLDASRLFYLPRHGADRPFGLHIIAGDLLDLDAIETVSLDGKEEDIFARAADDLAGSDPVDYEGFNLRRWAAESANGFQIADLFQSVGIDHVYETIDDGKLTVQCPFDFEHSEGQSADDKGCYVQNAQAGNTDTGFVFRCRHNACTDRDRLQMLRGALERNFFPIECLSDTSYMLLTEESVERAEEARESPSLNRETERIAITSAINALDGTATTMQVERLLRRIAKIKLSPLESAPLLNAIHTRSNRTYLVRDLKTTLTRFEREAQRDEANAGNDDLTPEQRFDRDLERQGIERSRRYRRQKRVFNDGTKQRSVKEDLISWFNEFNQGEDVCAFDYGDIQVQLELIKANEGDPFKSPKVFFQPMTVPHFSNIVERFVGFYTREDDGTLVESRLDERTLKELMALPYLRFKKLDGFATMPFFTIDGDVVTEFGYHEDTRTFLKPLEDVQFPSKSDLPEVITQEDIDYAWETLKYYWGDFPFHDGLDGGSGAASFAHFIALLLTPFIRPMINWAPIPMFLVTKPSPGTGASLLLETALMVCQGENQPITNNYTTNEEETEKRILGAFLAGRTNFWIDNINQRIEGGVLANAATSAVVSGRILGGSKMATFPNRMIWIFSGNNVKGSSEIMRRLLPIRLDARGDPRDRDPAQFKIQGPLRLVVQRDRKEIIRCLFMLIKNWIDKGMPEPNDSTNVIMSFEQWSICIGGILDAAQIEGFLGNMHLTLQEADAETKAWKSFVQGWWDEQTGGKNRSKVTMAELANIYISSPDRPDLPGLRFVDDPDALKGPLGRLVAAKRDNTFKIFVDESRLGQVTIHAEDGPRGVTLWSLVPTPKG